MWIVLANQFANPAGLLNSLFVAGAGFVRVSSAYNSYVRALTFVVVSYQCPLMFWNWMVNFKIMVLSNVCKHYTYEAVVVQEIKTSATFQQ